MGVGVVIAIAVATLIIGVVVGKFVFKADVDKQLNLAKSLESNAKREADIILRDAKADAENLKKEKMVEAKEYFLKQKSEHDEEIKRKERKLIEAERKVEEAERRQKGKEQSLNQKIENYSRKEKELDETKESLQRQIEVVQNKQEELSKAQDTHIAKLEQVSQLSAEDAKAQLIENLIDKAKTESMAQVKAIVEETKVKANKEAKKIIIQSIQRVAAESAIENAVSVFNLKSDDQKGQIIGREGRNIRALEAATGVEIIVDDTPDAIIISGYDPYRREIARLSLVKLVADGRIHPARIEEVVVKTTKLMEAQLIEIGERTVIDMGVHGLQPEIIRLIGKMRFRSSYGQNLLKHSREVANLCAIMASELGLNVKLAKRAGLLHDIGKVGDDQEMSHALLGAKICERNGEHPAIINAVGAHHDEMEMQFLISPIIQACDAISGARPGARREIMESYLNRIKDLENLALSYKGVQKAYAIQAGRELRVIVESNKVTDKEVDDLSFQISQQIQDEMTYPGQIKITVIREKRAVSVAK
jgi:ribonuclease Y